MESWKDGRVEEWKGGRVNSIQINMIINRRLSSLFQAAIEATEEAVINSMTMATTMTGRNGRRMPAIPLDRLRQVMQQYGR